MINPKLYLQGPKQDAERLLLKDKSTLTTEELDLLNEEFPILMLFSVNKKRIQYYTQIQMPLKYYVKGKKYPFSNKWIHSPAIKIKLDTLLSHTYSIESEFIKNGTLQTVDVYRKRIDEEFKGRGENVPLKINNIEDIIVEYLNYVKKHLSHNSFRNAQTNLNHLRFFYGKRINTTIISDLNEQSIQEYHNYIKVDRLNNTVVKCMAILKMFLRYCLKKEYISKIPSIDFGKENDITVIHLTYDEVMKIAYTPMPSLALDRVKDFFLMGCFTGMRYGDISSLTKTNCRSDKIYFFNSKNSATQTTTIPLTPVSKSIIEKYKNTSGPYAIPSISNQKTNDHLKIVAKLSGIDNEIEIAHKNGFGKIIKETTTKDKLISCHTSRKSFITISMSLGMPESTIISITQHVKGSKAFHKYYDVVDSTKFKQMDAIFNR